MNLSKQVYSAITITVVLTLLLGVAYPMVITGLAQLFFPQKANGSLILKDNQVAGSRLIGQPFSGPGYFHPRPSAAGNGYDATSSGGSNLGPTSKQLIEDNVEIAAAALHKEEAGLPIPVDLVTSSASGLDPDITPAAAHFQVARVARHRAMSENDLEKMVQRYTSGRQMGVLGEPHVNVLELNLALDAAFPLPRSMTIPPLGNGFSNGVTRAAPSSDSEREP